LKGAPRVLSQQRNDLPVDCVHDTGAISHLRNTSLLRRHSRQSNH